MSYGCPILRLVEENKSADGYRGNYREVEAVAAALLATINEGIIFYSAAFALSHNDNVALQNTKDAFEF